MAEKLVLLSKKDFKQVGQGLKKKGWALVSTRRAIVDTSSDPSGTILPGDVLILCDQLTTANRKVLAIGRNRPSHDLAPAFIKCVPA